MEILGAYICVKSKRALNLIPVSLYLWYNVTYKLSVDSTEFYKISDRFLEEILLSDLNIVT